MQGRSQKIRALRANDSRGSRGSRGSDKPMTRSVATSAGAAVSGEGTFALHEVDEDVVAKVLRRREERSATVD
jgi:hypothetical protein